MTRMADGGLAGPRTYVLVHGAWHGGWCWRDVAEPLRRAGHRVFTPTCTGLGERAHLLSADITLDTFITDIANVLVFEGLEDVVLVGHSFGGLAISGVADRMPERIRQLVYLDSLLVQPGQRPLDILPHDVAQQRTELAKQSSGGLSLPAPPPAAFGVDEPQAAEWLQDRLRPHPFGTYTSTLDVRGPIGNGLPRTYIACTEPAYTALQGVWDWVRKQAGWNWLELATGHDAMVTAPDDLCDLLMAIAGD
jgi:pimeloyl-ACP methyl ester carboxylesterase